MDPEERHIPQSGFLLSPEQLAPYIELAKEKCGLVTEGDPRMLRAVEEVVHVVRSDAIITFVGEPGTGKEGFARLVHAMHSGNDAAEKPFVRVNMAGLTEDLFAGELFGHVRGAFTSASTNRVGHFEAAGDGTILLDEVGDIPFQKQGILLRPLSRERTYYRVGDNIERTVEAKIVCATNADLRRAVQLGKLRQDLHDRITQCTIVLPPLRERAEEHRSALIRSILDRLTPPDHDKIEMDADAYELLLQKTPMQGNVRTIENVLLRAVRYVIGTGKKRMERIHVLQAQEQCNGSGGDMAEVATLGTTLYPLAVRMTLPELMDRLEEGLVQSALHDCDGNKTLAAHRLGIERSTFHRYENRALRHSDAKEELSARR